MCLQRIKDIPLRVNKNGYIQAWKLISKDNGGDHYDYKFKIGVNRSKKSVNISGLGTLDKINYTLGFHCFTNRRDARIWRNESGGFGHKEDGGKLIKVFIKPEDVIIMGEQIVGIAGLKCLVAKRIEIKSLEHCR